MTLKQHCDLLRTLIQRHGKEANYWTVVKQS